MAEALRRLAVCAILGWLPLLIGLFLLGAAALGPAWWENRVAAWQRDRLVAEAERLAAERRNYRRFLKAIRHNDPAALDRLAFAYFGITPPGARFLGTEGEIPAAARRVRKQPVDAWLAVPAPERPTPPQPPSWLRHLEGPRRLVVYVAAGCFLIAGLLPTRRELAEDGEAVPGSQAHPAAATPSG